MATTVVPFSRPRPPSLVGHPPSSHTDYVPIEGQRLSEFITLMKPRVMLLAVFTALVGSLQFSRLPPGLVPPVSSIIGTTPTSMA